MSVWWWLLNSATGFLSTELSYAEGSVQSRGEELQFSYPKQWLVGGVLPWFPPKQSAVQGDAFLSNGEFTPRCFRVSFWRIRYSNPVIRGKIGLLFNSKISYISPSVWNVTHDDMIHSCGLNLNATDKGFLSTTKNLSQDLGTHWRVHAAPCTSFSADTDSNSVVWPMISSANLEGSFLKKSLMAEIRHPLV